MAFETVVLASFAFGQPLLALIGDNPTFLVAHELEGWKTMVFGAVVAMVPGMVLAGLTWLLGRLGKSVYRWSHAVMLGLLLAFTVAPPFNRAIGSDGPGSLWVLGLAAAVSVGLFARLAAMRTAVRWASPAPLVFLGAFIVGTFPIWSSGSTAGGGVRVDPVEHPPIVWMVFDQLPLALLLNENGGLHTDRYPGFAALARSSTWYRNAITVAPHTNLAMPSMLTGNRAHPRLPPLHRSYPTNIFTLLADSYSVSARESVTRLCPQPVCAGAETPPTTTRQLLSDMGIMAARTVLADGVADGFLPEINDRWADFAGTGFRPGRTGQETRTRGDDRWRFEEFLADIGSQTDGAFHYLHQEKPHEPLIMLPDGRTYDFCSCYYTTADGRWPEDQTMLDQRLQQYVMQTMYVDGQLGRVFDRLRESGLFADSLIVVSSDHGASMLPGNINRDYSADTRDDVFPVPLFIKLPGQVEGIVDDRRVTIVDIVPTVLDALGATFPPEAFDGSSLLGDLGSRSPAILTEDGPEKIAWPRAAESPLIEMALTLMPVPDNPFVFGRFGHMVGASVEDLQLGTSQLEVDLAIPAGVVAVDPDSDHVPAHIIGEVIGATGPTDLAVAVNGVVAGVGRSYDRGLWRLSLMADPELFVEGANEVWVYEIVDSGLLQLEPATRS